MFSSLSGYCLSDDGRSSQGKENIYLNSKSIGIRSLRISSLAAGSCGYKLIITRVLCVRAER